MCCWRNRLLPMRRLELLLLLLLPRMAKWWPVGGVELQLAGRSATEVGASTRGACRQRMAERRFDHEAVQQRQKGRM